MIECAYGRKFPELVLHFDGNIWIESHSIQLKKTQWRNRKTGQIVDEGPDNLSSLKNMKMHVTLPTHPFIYSSKFGTWSNATFENGDEDYFEEISIGPCSHRGGSSNNASSSILDQDIKRKQQTKESRALTNDNKEVRRNSSNSHKGLKLSAESTAAVSPNTNVNKPDSPRSAVNTSRLSTSRLSATLTSAVTPRTPVTSTSSAASSALAENQAQILARDEAKSKHHTQLGSHFVKPGGSALLRGSASASMRKLSVSASRSNSISEANNNNTSSSTADSSLANTTMNMTTTSAATLDSISEDISLSHKACIFSPTRKEAYSNKKFGESTDEEENGNNPNNLSAAVRRPPPPPPPPPRLPSPRGTSGVVATSNSINNTPSMKLFLPVSTSSSVEEDDDDEDGYSASPTVAKPIMSKPPVTAAPASSHISPRLPSMPPPPPPLSPRQFAAIATVNNNTTTSSINHEVVSGFVATNLDRSTSSSSTLTSSSKSKSHTTGKINGVNGVVAGSATAVVRPLASGTGAALDATQRNKEFFKRVKEQEDEERQRKEQETPQLDASTLAAMKEQELSADLHNNEKTKHYAKLGSTFAVKGPAGNAILQSRSKVTATSIPSSSISK